MKKTLTVMLIAVTFLFAEDFRFYTDHACFYDKETPFVELYYMLPRHALGWKSAGEGQMQGKFLMAVNIYDNDEHVYAKTVAVEDRCSVGDTILVHEYIPEQLGLHLEPGTYELHTVVRDFHSGATSESRRDIRIRSFTGSHLEISDIVVASYAGKTDDENKFTKPGMYDIVPMANPEFDNASGIFYTYFEVYQLSPGKAYGVQSSIRDLDGNIIVENEEVKAVAPGKFDVVIDYMDIRELDPGIYQYCVRLEDKNTGETANADRRVFMTGETDMDALLYDDHYALGEEALDSMFQVLRPLMTQDEIRTYRRSNADARQKLFVEFWKKRDSDMTTPVNEYYLQIRERVRYADEHFTYMNKGAGSDRGRVLLKYGHPTEIRRSGFVGGEKDHEIWYYEGMRGEVFFVFCDLRGRGYYELIHSNMEGERKNENWRAVIQGGAKNY